QEHVREILVAPREHKTNRQLIVSDLFWKNILKEVVNELLWKFREQTYPVECYAINFGSWESETAKDKNALECHGHFHLHLNKVVVHNMEQEKGTDNLPIYPAIHGKVNDPYQYRMKDCVDLETLRLSSLEINANYNSLREQIDEQ
ncbi:18754_t:CDS:1, partial [Funneliformis geosporum]